MRRKRSRYRAYYNGWTRECRTVNVLGSTVNKSVQINTAVEVGVTSVQIVLTAAVGLVEPLVWV